MSSGGVPAPAGPVSNIGGKILMGLGAVTAAAMLAVAQIKQQREDREKRRKAQAALADAISRPSVKDLRSRAFLELIPYLADKRPKGFQTAFYQRMKLTASAGSFTLPPALAYHCFMFLSLPEAIASQRVCRSWRDFLAPLLQDRCYLKLCAARGFDGYPKIVRGRCWYLLTECKLPTDTELKAYDARCETKSATYEEIGRDGDRTLIHYKDFETEQLAVDTLVNLLNAYSIVDQDLGYTQGMNFVGGFLLTKLPEQQAFHLLNHIFRVSPRYHMRSLYLKDLPGLKLSQFQFARLFEWYMPKLSQHFAKHNVSTDLFMPEWFMTLFTYRAIPSDVSARIWDLFLSDGWKALHRSGLAVLKTSEDTLMELEFEGIVQYLKLFPDQGVFQPDAFIKRSKSFKVTNRLLHRLTQLYNQQLQ